jgi:hypothetical protein
MTQLMGGGPPAHREGVKRARKIEELAVRRSRAWELYVANATFEQIGKQLKISTKTAWDDVTRRRDEIEREGLLDANALRARQQAGIDRLKRRHFGRLGDETTADRATAAILAAYEREARLNGLDAKPKDGLVSLDAVAGLLRGLVGLFHELVGDDLLRRRFADGMRRLGPVIDLPPEPPGTPPPTT